MESIIAKPYRVSPQVSLRWCLATVPTSVKWSAVVMILVGCGLIFWDSQSHPINHDILFYVGIALPSMVLAQACIFWGSYIHDSRFHEVDRQLTFDEDRLIIGGSAVDAQEFPWGYVLKVVDLPDCYILVFSVKARTQLHRPKISRLFLPKRSLDADQLVRFSELLQSKEWLERTSVPA